MAFHEKAGRSQVDSCLFLLLGTFSSPAEWPLSPCFHPHSRGAISFRSVHVGRSRLQPALPSDYRPVVLLLQSGTWARPLTQSPELGFGLCLFSSWNGFDFVLSFVLPFYAAAATVGRPLLCNGSYASPLTHR